MIASYLAFMTMFSAWQMCSPMCVLSTGFKVRLAPKVPVLCHRYEQGGLQSAEHSIIRPEYPFVVSKCETFGDNWMELPGPSMKGNMYTVLHIKLYEISRNLYHILFFLIFHIWKKKRIKHTFDLLQRMCNIGYDCNILHCQKGMCFQLLFFFQLVHKPR